MKVPIQAAPVQRMNLASATLLKGGVEAAQPDDELYDMSKNKFSQGIGNFAIGALKAFAPSPGGNLSKLSGISNLVKGAYQIANSYLPPHYNRQYIQQRQDAQNSIQNYFSKISY
jgi:hypothetical protein